MSHSLTHFRGNPARLRQLCINRWVSSEYGKREEGRQGPKASRQTTESGNRRLGLDWEREKEYSIFVFWQIGQFNTYTYSMC